MKKIFSILLCLGAILVPSIVEAKSYSVNYYCDAKQPLDDETFYLTCHILINSSEMNINHVSGSFILKNVELTDIKTNSDWANNNGLSTNVDFTSASVHTGSFSVADVVFTGKLSDTECEASFSPNTIEESIVETPEPSKDPEPTKDPEPSQTISACSILENTYYGKNATVVSEETYYEECCNYICTVVDNKYYFNSQGKSVSYDVMVDDCSTTTAISNPQTGINYGYIILPLGILSIIAIVKFAKKNQKIYKI